MADRESQSHKPSRRSIRRALSAPVSAQSLAAFRIAFGALMLWDCWRFIKYDRIWRYYVAPDFHFTYPGFGWVQPLPEPWIQFAWLMVGATAFLVMIGLFYRVAIVGFTLLFTYFFLLDQVEYLNHFYLVILFAILLCFLPANRAWALDTWIMAGRRSVTVPYASVFILRAQMEIMLIYAGLVKLTPDWLAGEPLGMWLRRQADDVPMGWLLHYDAVIVAGTWGTVALHLIGAPLLLWRRTRLPTFAVYCVFHAANAYFFNIGIFPWLTIAATTIFFAPDWPTRMLRCMRGRIGTLPAAPPAMPHPARPLPAAVMAALGLWCAVQIAVPLRSELFSTEVRWSGDGHRFSWRMRIYDRHAEGVFVVTDPATSTEWVIDPEDYLTPRQADKMLVRADMIHQFARHLEEIWLEAGYAQVSVRAEIRKSLNGRPPQAFVDPHADLTLVSVNRFGPDPWILPLDLPVWGVASGVSALGSAALSCAPEFLLPDGCRSSNSRILPE
ncbi:MAG: HTTM domain-containing protein [Alphaproteobacteria bacterium]